MKIGIVIAIAKELKEFLESDFKLEILNQDNRIIYKTNVNNNEIYALKSGCGQIDASSATQYLITKFGVELILNYGVTGALDEKLKVTDLFVVEKVVNSDFDVSPVDPVKEHQYEEFPTIYMPLTKSLIDKALEIDNSLKLATVASGNKFIYKLDEKNALHNELKCDICEMEIAAITRTCLLNNVKVLSIKSISDTLYGDGSDFIKNVQYSSNLAFNLFKKLLYSL